MHASRLMLATLVGAVSAHGGCGGGGTLTGAGGNMGTGSVMTGSGGLGNIPGISIGGLSGNNPGDGICSGRPKPAQPLPPDILIALDTSSSMNDDLGSAACAGGCGQTSKWAATAAAINSVVAGTGQRVNWGIVLFGIREASLCGTGPSVYVDTSPLSAVAIADALRYLTTPNGGVYGTETRQTRGAVDAARVRLLAWAAPSLKRIVLITDGAPMCAPDGISVAEDTAGTVAAITATATAGVPTFVIGVATGNGPADTSILMMGGAGSGADGGGSFTTSTGDDIRAALEAVADQTADCTFAVPEGSADGTLERNHIGVAVNGIEIRHDTNRVDGWDYVDATHASVRLYGPQCAAVTADDHPVVSVIFKCIFI